MEEWSMFVFGVGECGKKIVSDLYNLKKTKTSMFCITDTAPGDIKEFMGEELEKDSRIVIKENKRIKIIIKDKVEQKEEKSQFVYFRMLLQGARGVGGYWVASKVDAEDNMEKYYYKEFSDRLEGEYSCFLTINSAGGGTGCGAAPVFAERIRKRVSEKRKGSHSLDLFLGVLVLPDENEGEPERMSGNTFSCILRYRNIVDGILLIDNDHFIEKNLGKKEINSRIINFWNTLSESCKSSKEFEPADMKRLSGRGIDNFRAGIIVPCYGEYEPQILKSGINLKGLILRTLVDGSFADIDFTKGFRSVIVIITLPETSRFDLEIIKNELGEYIREFFPLRKKEAQVLCKRKGDKIRVAIFVADPHIPRLEEICAHFVNYVKDEEKLKEEIGRFNKDCNPASINKDLEEFKDVIKPAKKIVEENFLVLDKRLIEALKNITWCER